MKREAHFPALDRYYDAPSACACANYTQNRKVQRVTDKLQGKGKHHKGQHKEGGYQFGFSGFKDYSHDDELGSLRYVFAGNKLQIYTQP